MALVNCSVINKTNNRILLPWSILPLTPSGVTTRQFFDDIIVCRLDDVSNLELEFAMLGKSKESLDRIELSLSLEPAIQLFGPFLRYQMQSISHGPSQVRNAFTILMHNQRLLSQPRVPEMLQVRNQKDKLYNDIIQMLNDEKLKFPASSVSSSGKNFVKTLSDLLWYIDGHQGTITKQGFPIPNCFLKFEGYNVPEMAKHRKRQHTNLSVDVLNSLSSSLFLNLQASFWAALPWQHLKRKMELIASSVSNYAVYLSSQSKKMSEAHHQTTPVRQLSNSLSIKYLKPCRQNTMFEAISESLTSKGYHECLFLNDFLPSDARKRYGFIQCLEKSGLAYPIILLTHSSGNNLGNLNFVWKVESDVSIDIAFNPARKLLNR